MIRHLPPDSALYRELTGDWSVNHEYAAAGLEIAHAHYRATLAAAGVKRSNLPKPLRLDRPTPWTPSVVTPNTTRPPRQPQRRKATTVAEVVSALQVGFGPKRR